MITPVKAYTIPCTPALAKDVSNLPRCPCERPLKKGRLSYLESEIADGNFHTPTWAFGWLNGVKYRVNGQHSSTALSTANGHFPSALNVHIEEFQCDTMRDLIDLFWRFDNPASVRSNTELVHAAKSEYAELNETKTTIVKMAIAGLSFWFSEGAEKVPADDQAKLIHENTKFVLWYAAFGHYRGFRRSSIVAAMYATWSKDSAKATEFWTSVRDESHPDNRNPSRVLAKFLLECCIRPMKGVATRYPSRAFFVKAVHAWNAWRTGTNTDLKYHHKSPWPKAL